MTVNLNRLKAERVAKGLTQAEMATLMGFKTPAPWTKRENGTIGLGADELGKAAQILDIPMSNLSIFFTPSVPEREQK